MFPGEGKRLQDIIYFLLNKMPNYIYQKFLCYSSRISEILCVLLRKLLVQVSMKTVKLLDLLYCSQLLCLISIFWFVFFIPLPQKESKLCRRWKEQTGNLGLFTQKSSSCSRVPKPNSFAKPFPFFHK